MYNQIMKPITDTHTYIHFCARIIKINKENSRYLNPSNVFDSICVCVFMIQNYMSSG